MKRFACKEEKVYLQGGLITYFMGKKKLCKPYTNPTFNPTSRWFSARYEMYSLRRKPCTNYTQNLTFIFEHESNGWSEWIVRNASNVRNECNERDERDERNGSVTGQWRVGDGVTEVSREQSFIISFKSAPFLKH